MRIWALLITAGMGVPAGLAAQGTPAPATSVTISGRVIGADDGRGVSGAAVRLGSDPPIIAGAGGEFTGRVPASKAVQLVASAIGFRPESATVDIGQDALTLTITLARANLVLDTTRVIAESGPPGFEARRRTGKGFFFGRKDLEAQTLPSVADLMRTLPGVRMRSQGRGFEYTMTFDRCSQVIVFMDGHEVRGWTPAETLRMINPATLTGVEVYSSPSRVPAEFRRIDSCGAVVLWTK